MNDHAIERYQSHFDVVQKSINGESHSVVNAKRLSAMTRFAEIGFPDAKNEEWRFTNISPIARTQFHIADRPDADSISGLNIQPFILGDDHWLRLVFVNGHFIGQLSQLSNLPKGVRVASLSASIKTEAARVEKFLGSSANFEENPFVALSTAFMREGAFISIDDGVALERPIQLMFVSTGMPHPQMTNPRNLIVVGKDSKAQIVEGYYHTDDAAYFTNSVSEIRVSENAHVEFDRVINESDAAYHISTMHVEQFRSSNFRSHAIALSGAIVRNNATAVLGGEGAECTLNGLSLGTGEELIDNHTTIDHATPNCNSHELYKAILDGKSRGVFNGKIYVRKDAQKTDAKQTNKTLLLSDDATIDTKPQLEIFADDVKCTHGATVGQLNEEQIFYLRARGIGLDDARDILTKAFAGSVIAKINLVPLREALDAMIQDRLHHGRLSRSA